MSDVTQTKQIPKSVKNNSQQKLNIKFQCRTYR